MVKVKKQLVVCTSSNLEVAISLLAPEGNDPLPNLTMIVSLLNNLERLSVVSVGFGEV